MQFQTLSQRIKTTHFNFYITLNKLLKRNKKKVAHKRYKTQVAQREYTNYR